MPAPRAMDCDNTDEPSDARGHCRWRWHEVLERRHLILGAEPRVELQHLRERDARPCLRDPAAMSQKNRQSSNQGTIGLAVLQTCSGCAASGRGRWLSAGRRHLAGTASPMASNPVSRRARCQLRRPGRDPIRWTPAIQLAAPGRPSAKSYTGLAVQERRPPVRTDPVTNCTRGPAVIPEGRQSPGLRVGFGHKREKDPVRTRVGAPSPGRRAPWRRSRAHRTRRAQGSADRSAPVTAGAAAPGRRRALIGWGPPADDIPRQLLRSPGPPVDPVDAVLALLKLQARPLGTRGDLGQRHPVLPGARDNVPPPAQLPTYVGRVAVPPGVRCQIVPAVTHVGAFVGDSGPNIGGTILREGRFDALSATPAARPPRGIRCATARRTCSDRQTGRGRVHAG